MIRTDSPSYNIAVYNSGCWQRQADSGFSGRNKRNWSSRILQDLFIARIVGYNNSWSIGCPVKLKITQRKNRKLSHQAYEISWAALSDEIRFIT